MHPPPLPVDVSDQGRRKPASTAPISPLDRSTADGQGRERGTVPRIVLNPISGGADHADRVRRLASEYGWEVFETRAEGDARLLTMDAVRDGIDVIVACGGDGTIHEVVQGIVETNALDDVALGILPAGTANRFATDIGIETVEHGFEVLADGRTRQIDLGIAGDEPFVMSSITGLTAEASGAASPELKERFGTFAFVITGLRKAIEFEPLEMTVTGITEDGVTEWSGAPICVLVGNSRRFVNEGCQANVEDGLLEVTIVKEMPTVNLLEEGAVYRLFGRETDHIDRMMAEGLVINSESEEPAEFSLDGEICAHDRLSLSTLPGALEVYVGPTYDPKGSGEPGDLAYE